MAVTAHWSGVPYAFRVDDGAGHSVFTDEARPIGGARGPDPVDLLLGALCACSGTSVLTLLERMRQRVDELSVRAEGERQAEWPRAFTAIRLHFSVGASGPLDDALVRKAVALGVTRYCPVEGTLTLGRDGCVVTYDVTIAALGPNTGPGHAADRAPTPA